MLANVFFFKKLAMELPNLQNQEYLDPICTAKPMTRDQIHKQQLAKLKLYKAPSSDSISNIVLTKNSNILINRLQYIYVAITTLNIYHKF